MAATQALFSIGHSNHSLDRLIELLRAHQIEVVVDVRSQPYSKHAPHFTKASLEQALVQQGLRYVFAGEALGGRPRGEQYYDAGGVLLHERRSAAADFIAAIDELVAAAERNKIALLCAEEDPARCHRHHLVGRVLADRDVGVVHIRADGRLQPATLQLKLL